MSVSSFLIYCLLHYHQCSKEPINCDVVLIVRDIAIVKGILCLWSNYLISLCSGAY